MIENDNLRGNAAPRLITAQKLSAQEEQLERALRPKFLADYIGQHKAKEQLDIFIQAAKSAAFGFVRTWPTAIVPAASPNRA